MFTGLCVITRNIDTPKKLKRKSSDKGDMRSISKKKKKYILKHYGNISTNQLAKMLRISESTVYRVIKSNPARKTCHIVDPKPCGRKPYIFSIEDAEKIMEYRTKYRANCNTLEKLLLEKEGLRISHNQIYKLLKSKGLIYMQKNKRRKRSWVRFERKHSLSLWQGDWKLLKNGNWLIAFKDDASRLITTFGEFPNATSENSVKVLTEGIQIWGKPKAILTGRDAQFYASSKKGRPAGENYFQKFLGANDIQHIL